MQTQVTLHGAPLAEGCPVEAMAREAAEIAKVVHEVDCEVPGGYLPSPEARARSCRLFELQDKAMDVPARSPVGACWQLANVAWRCEVIRSELDHGPGLPEAVNKQLRDIERIAQAALFLLAEKTGVDGSEFYAPWYMHEDAADRLARQVKAA